MSNILKFDFQAREKLLKGVNILAEAVASTLGPKGRNVAIEQAVRPLVIHDGVTVARRIDLKDPFEKIGADLVREAASKTNDKAGDGTTTATILAQAIITEGLKEIQAGINPMTLKKSIENRMKIVLEELEKMTKKVTTDEEITQIATIASTDPELGKLVAEALIKVGTDGVVTVEEGSSMVTAIDYKQGMEIDRGYISPYFVTNEQTIEAEIKNPYILLTDIKLNHNFDVIPFLDKFYKESKKPLVIIGQVGDEALSTIVINKLRNGLELLAIEPPAFGSRRIDELEDIAILTGGKVISQDSGRTLDSVIIEELGQAEKITANKDKTVILGGKGATGTIKRRMDDLKAQITLTNTDFDRDIKKQRLAKLAGGVAVINVGATTEVEMQDKRERVIDAVNATKAAIEEGIVAGGEITLLKLAKGTDILSQALKQPFKRLIENAGLDYGEIREKMAGTEYPFGIDVMDGKVKDLIKAGIIDPVKVTRSALENAVSVAIMLLTTNTLIVEDKNEKT